MEAYGELLDKTSGARRVSACFSTLAVMPFGTCEALLVQFSLARPGLVLVRPRVAAWNRLGRRCRLA